MAIRAFLTTWTLVDGEIHTPIVDHIDTQPDMGIIVSLITDNGADGLPDGPLILALVESNRVAGAALEVLGNLEGVDLIPPQRPDKKISSLPASARANLDDLVARNKIPASAVTGSDTLGDVLRAIEAHIFPASNGVARYLAARPAEFG